MSALDQLDYDDLYEICLEQVQLHPFEPDAILRGVYDAIGLTVCDDELDAGLGYQLDTQTPRDAAAWLVEKLDVL